MSAVILHVLPMSDYIKTRLYGFYSLTSGVTLETEGATTSSVVMDMDNDHHDFFDSRIDAILSPNEYLKN